METGLVMEGVVVTRTLAGGELTILDGVTASFGAGRVTFVTGDTGAGKSTLIHLLSGLRRPTQGVVLADGEPISRWTAAHRDRWRQRVGLALQTPHLIEGLTALENVIVPGIPRGWRLSRLRAEGRAALERIGAEALAGRKVEGLSGGERQRVALARAFLGQPEVLLLDEPTAHQDLHGGALVVAALLEARAQGATVVVATHDPRLGAEAEPDATVRLEHGRVRGPGGEEP